ncbi:DUF3592 domain-containing protein [Fulvivirga ligni]|uniref:DUF3592 domain-containing protein n=1 Tax=Fulvivirga ligni TaxID=2904246 RepID=UPI001F33E9B3|nr:DUF3592 domain-containing protein [Fulvivirga ligni]UII23972.1 DUF3592 domain-containing protein [Fulvivirga ligni]
MPLLLGAILFAINLYLYIRCRELMSKGKRTDATVNDFVFKNDLYYPIVHYTTEDDEMYLKRLSGGTNPPKYKRGDKIPIIYQPHDPENFIIDDPASTVRMYTIGMVAGLALTVVCGLEWIGYINVFPI